MTAGQQGTSKDEADKAGFAANGPATEGRAARAAVGQLPLEPDVTSNSPEA